MRWGGPTPDPDLEGRYSLRGPNHRHFSLGVSLLIIGLFVLAAVIAAIIRML